MLKARDRIRFLSANEKGLGSLRGPFCVRQYCINYRSIVGPATYTWSLPHRLSRIGIRIIRAIDQASAILDTKSLWRLIRRTRAQKPA
jgi:hypothetical protein